MSARDMAKFGVLYQKNGRWKSFPITPNEWADESTMAYSTMENPAGLGYGYLWKIIPEDSQL
jgi:CubicO group peptidase (beta-lactamase class C family)